MRRRDFIKAIASSTAAWPFAARAQQSIRRIGVIMALAANDQAGQQEADALRQGLQELGWIDGASIQMDYRWNAGEPARARVAAQQILATQPDLIVSHAPTATNAVFQLTKSIPIVFVSVPDPAAAFGLISDYAHPGSNMTGFSNYEQSMAGKWVEILKDLDPRIRRVAIIFNPETAPGGGEFFLPSYRAASAALGVEAIEASVHDDAGIEDAISALAREHGAALISMADIFTSLHRKLIIQLALNYRLPLIGAFRNFTDQGALVFYGSNTADLFRRAASYVDRILRGEKPGDLPIQTPTKFEMVINLKTAKLIGLSVSHDFLLRADDIVE